MKGGGGREWRDRSGGGGREEIGSEGEREEKGEGEREGGSEEGEEREGAKKEEKGRRDRGWEDGRRIVTLCVFGTMVSYHKHFPFLLGAGKHVHFTYQQDTP